MRPALHAPVGMLLCIVLALCMPLGAAFGFSAADSRGPCFRRTNISLPACARTTKTTKGGWYTTWTVANRVSPGNGSWEAHRGLNCFTNKAQGWKGGTPIAPEPFARAITLEGCQAACLRDVQCAAIVMPTSLHPAPSPPLPSPPRPDSAAQALQRRIAAAISSGARKLVVAGGVYHFGATNFEIEGAADLDLLAPEPVHLWFAKPAGLNITNCRDLSLGNLSINYETGGAAELPSVSAGKGITLNLLNSSRVSVSDVNITGASFMVITAWNGYGDHRFTRVHFEPSLGRKCRDALHFSDQKVGPTFVDCVIGYTGDDLFNIHTTLQIVLKCETPTSCLMVNPHLGGPAEVNTVYATNSIIAEVRPGDQMSFFSWPSSQLKSSRYGGAAPPLTVSRTARVTNNSLLAEAVTLPTQLAHHGSALNPVSMRNTTVGWQAWDLWRVEFTTAVPVGVGRTAYVQIDSIPNSGTVLRNNTFTDTNCNLGRFKSSHSEISGNVFTNAKIPSLELSWLPQFFEGPVILENVSVAGNTIEGESTTPIHCGPGCGLQTCLYNEHDSPTRPWTTKGCAACPDCYASVGGDTAWTKNIRLSNNTIRA